MTVFVFSGQGSQKVGMGEGLFSEFRALTTQANEILGYSIEELCLQGPQSQLSQTQFTQPALFIVEAIQYQKNLQESGNKPDFVAGHSLGEYAALYAAGVFDFATGVKLVKKRGELMSQVSGGGMAAVIGLDAEKIKAVLQDNNLESIDVANFNSLSQTVISGKAEDITAAKASFEAAGAMMYVPLPVSGAFHSRYMQAVNAEFKSYLEQFDFNAPQIPVIANLTAKPYETTDIIHNLAEQIDHPVQWVASIRYLLEQEETEFVEVGPGKVLSGLIARIKQNK